MKVMEKVVRNVAEIDSADRRAIEHLIGRNLDESQQVVISVVNLDLATTVTSKAPDPGVVPAWWNVYEGLGDEEVDRLDQAIRRRTDLTRTPG
jgi:hypothetical protein